ncbi:MAG: hypothetical protein RLZZ324_381 [Candidatus Parcubacteria bacterium]
MLRRTLHQACAGSMVSLTIADDLSERQTRFFAHTVSELHGYERPLHQDITLLSEMIRTGHATGKKTFRVLLRRDNQQGVLELLLNEGTLKNAHVRI